MTAITITTTSPIAFGELKGWLRELSASQSALTLTLLRATFPNLQVDVADCSQNAHTRPLIVACVDRERYTIALEFSGN